MRSIAPGSSNLYYAEIAKVSHVDDPDEERRLIRAWQEKGDTKARDTVVQTHLRFVVKMAHKRTKDPEAVKDYIAAGNLGLLKAADKFDWRRKPYIRFLTYAGWWVYEEMSSQDYMSSSLVHVPAHRQKAQRRQARKYRAAIQEMGPDAVADMDPGLPEGVVVALDHAKNVPEVEEVSAGESQYAALVREAINKLPVREQTVLNLYFGVKDEPRNHLQIGRMMNMCPERVRQIKLSAMQMLQDSLKDKIKLTPEEV
jgi:RNA polymerase primary sigma factor